MLLKNAVQRIESRCEYRHDCMVQLWCNETHVSLTEF
uniref:Uncharacterized protein n=1 Tax=Anguilla anguilla TaxID=7936 RepID=A0A0E9T447_ANGAN